MTLLASDSLRRRAGEVLARDVSNRGRRVHGLLSPSASQREAELTLLEVDEEHASALTSVRAFRFAVRRGVLRAGAATFASAATRARVAATTTSVVASAAADATAAGAATARA